MSGYESGPNSEGIETERKFEVFEVSEEILDGAERQDIVQGYVRVRGKIDIRLRSISTEQGMSYKATKKIGNGQQRPEIEIDITEEEFQTVWPLTAQRRIEKTRYKIHSEDEDIDLDIYCGDNPPLTSDGRPLIVAEIESPDKQTSDNISIPTWFDWEVTDDSSFKNNQLALRKLIDPKTGNPNLVPSVPLYAGLEALKTYTEILTRLSPEPVVVEIAGGSASGKTSAVADKMAEHFGDRAITISLDNYYRGAKYLRSITPKGEQINWDTPDAVNLGKARGHIDDLKSGKAIEMPIYDFKKGEQVGSEIITTEGKDVIIVEGLFAIAYEMPSRADITTFVSAEAHGRMMRRLLRDVKRSSWGPKDTLGYFSMLEKMHKVHVEPSKRQADIIISNDYAPGNEASRCEASEYQIKYLIEEGSKIDEEYLRKFGAELISSNLKQVDIYYNPSESVDLKKSDEIIRIRESEGALTFGYKGPRKSATTSRQRPKIEFTIDQDTLRAFHDVYTEPVKIIKKIRSLFLLDGIVLALDDVIKVDPASNQSTKVGRFIEFRSNEGDLKYKDLADRLELEANPLYSYNSYFDM
jgi:uridine kinase